MKRAPADDVPRTLPSGACPWWQPASLALLTALVFGSAVESAWVLDAKYVIRDDPAVRSHDWKSILTGDWWSTMEGAHDLYRPVARAWLSLLVPTPESGPRLINAANLVLHFVLAWLRLLLFRRLLPPSGHPWAFVAAAAALVHPSASEVVGSQVGAADLLAAVLVTGAILIGLRPGTSRMLAAAVLAALAVLSKESAVAVVVIAPATAWAASSRSDAEAPRHPVLRALGWSLAGAVLAVAVHMIVVPVAAASARAVLAGFPLGPRLATAFAAFATWTVPLLLGLRASLPVVTLQDLVPAAGFGDWRALVGLLLLTIVIVATVIAWRRRARLGVLSAAFVLAPLSVVSNVFVLIGAIAASRFVYPCVPGIVLPIAAIAARSSPSPTARKAGRAVLLVAIVGWGWRASDELRIWRDERTLYEASFARAPASVANALNLALDIQAENPARAASVLATGTESPLPEIPGTGLTTEIAAATAWDGWMMRARIAGDELHDPDLAARCLERAAETARKGRITGVALGSSRPWNAIIASAHRYRALLAIGRYAAAIDEATRSALLAEARRACDEMLAETPDDVPSAAVSARVLRLEGRTAEADSVVRSALQAHPGDPDLLLEHAESLRAAGKRQEALAAEIEALLRQGAGADPGRSLRAGKEALASTDPSVRSQGRALLGRIVQQGSNLKSGPLRTHAAEAARALAAAGSR